MSFRCPQPVPHPRPSALLDRVCAGQASPRHKAQQGKVVLLCPLWGRGCCQAQTLFHSNQVNLKERGTLPLFVKGSGSPPQQSHVPESGTPESLPLCLQQCLTRLFLL